MRLKDLLDKYARILTWYEELCKKANRHRAEDDPLLLLKGAGAHLWIDETPDEYVERLREG